MGELRDPRHPRDVLEAVRRLEEDIDALRTRAQATELADARQALAEMLAEDRRETVEDLERLMELVAAGWRSTRREIAGLAEEIRGLREEVRAHQSSLAGARLEMRLAERRPGNGSTGVGHPGYEGR